MLNSSNNSEKFGEKVYLTKLTFIDMKRFVRGKVTIELSIYTFDLYVFKVIYIARELPFIPGYLCTIYVYVYRILSVYISINKCKFYLLFCN